MVSPEEFQKNHNFYKKMADVMAKKSNNRNELTLEEIEREMKKSQRKEETNSQSINLSKEEILKIIKERKFPEENKSVLSNKNLEANNSDSAKKLAQDLDSAIENQKNNQANYDGELSNQVERKKWNF